MLRHDLTSPPMPLHSSAFTNSSCATVAFPHSHRSIDSVRMWMPLLLFFNAIFLAWISCASLAAIALRRAFANVRPALVPRTPSGSNMLDYAAPASISPWLTRWPWLAGLIAVVLTAWPLAIFAFLSQTDMVPQFWPALGFIVPALCAIAFVGHVLIAWRAVRLTSAGIPAGVSWRTKRLWWAELLVILAYAGLLLIVDSRLSNRLTAAATQASEKLAEISSQPADAVAGQKYAAAAKLLKPREQSLAWMDLDWNWQTIDPTYVEPPPFPDELLRVVELALDASAAASVDFGIDLKALSLGSVLPHLSQCRQLAHVLRWHAIDRARSGEWDSAMRDISAMQGLARQVAQRSTLVGGLVGLGIDQLSLDAIEQCLPFATSEQQLDRIPFNAEGWYSDAAVESLTVERWVSTRDLANLLLSGSMGPGAANRSFRPMLLRLFLADMELHDLQFGSEQAIARASKLRESAGLPPMAPGRSPMAGMLLPSNSRSSKVFFRGVTTSDMARLGIAVTRYRIRTGALPASFEELQKAGLIDAIPMDFWVGKPLRFVPSEHEVLIYSVGEDRVDDKGQTLGTKTRDDAFRIATQPLWILHPPVPVDSAEEQP